MILVIEILFVITAFILLVMSGLKMVKKAAGFGRSAKAMNEHTQPLIMALVSQSDMAQQRVFSITGNADLLQRKMESLRIAIGRILIVFGAIREVSDRASRGIRIIGF
ncbi:MAG: hypothetical protein Q7K29_00905 [Thermoleophilia bacterium]|nr:hypothetical protein [Thermoleophilia bacterium]